MIIRNKILAIAVAAIFCVAAISCAFSSNDDSAADSEKKTYTVYIEVINGSGIIEKSDWIKFTSEPDNEKFVKNANAAFAEYGYPGIVFSYSDSFIGITYNSSYSNVSFFEKNGSWQAVENTMSDYANSSTIGLALGNGYISEAVYDALSVSEKSKWSATGMGYGYDYCKTLGAKPSDCPNDITCHYFVEIIGSDGKVVSSKWIEFTSMKTVAAVAVNANVAFKAAGLEKLTMSVGEYGITVCYDSGFGNSCMYADGKEWKYVENMTSDYLNHTTIALSVSHGYISETVYKALSADQQKAWKDTGYGGDYAYQKVVTESTEGYKPAASSESDNTALIIGIVAAVIVIILIVVLVWYFKFRN